MKTTEKYETPVVKVIEVAVEKGYAGTLGGRSSDTNDDYEFGERS